MNQLIREKAGMRRMSELKKSALATRRPETANGQRFAMEEAGMNGKQISMWRKTLRMAIAVLTLGVSMVADAGLFGSGGASWKEEVLLHDGQKIIVERSQTYGGRSEPGQSGPVKEHTIRFTLPGATKTITWTSEYGEDLGRTNFNLLAVHALNGTPYLVASPNLCLSYNKWGRPNPPYVFFKYDGNAWQRIPLEQLPAEFTTLNVATNVIGRDVEVLTSLGLVSAEKIKEVNRSSAPEFKAILREAMPKEQCPQYSSGPKAPNPIVPSTTVK